MKKYYLILTIGMYFLFSIKVNIYAQCPGCVDQTTNLIIDGGFENINCSNPGTLPFTSDMTYTCNSGNWPIGTNPNGCFGLAFTLQSQWNASPNTGSNYFVGDGLYNTGNPAFNNAWAQNVNVISGQTYQFSCWIYTEDAANPGIRLAVDGNVISPTGTSWQNWARLCGNYTATSTGAVSLQIQKLRLNNGTGGNDFGLDDIEFRPVIAFDGTITPPQILCSGKSITLTAAGQNGSGSYSYLWNTGSTSSQITVAPTTITTYFVTITDNVNGCLVTLATQAAISNVNVNIGEDDIELCIASSNVLPAIVTGGSPPYSYQWSSGQTTSSISVNYNSPGPYSVIVTDNLGCSASDGVVTWQTPGTCASSQLFQNTSSLPPYNRYNQYIRAGKNVNPGSTQGNVIVTSNQNVIFKAGEYISLEDGFEVQSGGTFVAEIFNVCELQGEYIQVTDNYCSYTLTPILSGGSGNLSYLWNTGATTPQLTVNPTSPTSYSVTVTDNCLGGYDVINVTVTPHYRSSISVSLFPNLVTPNGDGQNDLWILDDNGKTEYAFNAYAATLEVYNIWGSRVWRQVSTVNPGSTGFTQGSIWWNPNNPDVSDGLYYAAVSLANCDQTITLKGWIHVVDGGGNKLATMPFAETPGTFSDTLNISRQNFSLKNNTVISPNPSSGIFEITFPAETDQASIYVYNSVGSIIREVLIAEKADSFKIDLSSEENGVYLIKINAEGECVIKKVILRK